MKGKWTPLLIILPAGLLIGLVAGRAVNPEMIQRGEDPLGSANRSAERTGLRETPETDSLALSRPSSFRPDFDYEREVWPEDYVTWRSEREAWPEDFGRRRNERAAWADDRLDSFAQSQGDYSYDYSFEPRGEDDFGSFGSGDPTAEQRSERHSARRDVSPENGTTDARRAESRIQSRPPAAPAPETRDVVPHNDGMPAIY